MTMTMQEAMRRRHTVRKYTDEGLSAEEVRLLEGRIDANNRELGTSISLVRNAPKAVSGVVRLALARNAKDYFLLAGDDAPDLGERLGYASADLMLYAQTLGLNTWWIGGTFNRKDASAHAGGKKAIGIVTVGHGASQGSPHKSKTVAEVSEYRGGPESEWFARGVEAALLTPTALNRQAFHLVGEGDRVTVSYDPGPLADADLGLVKYHFELGAGRENFSWA